MKSRAVIITTGIGAFLIAAAIGYVAVRTFSGDTGPSPAPSDILSAPIVGGGGTFPVVVPVAYDGDVDAAMVDLSEQVNAARVVASDLEITLEPSAGSGIALEPVGAEASAEAGSPSGGSPDSPAGGGSGIANPPTTEPAGVVGGTATTTGSSEIPPTTSTAAGEPPSGDSPSSTSTAATETPSTDAPSPTPTPPGDAPSPAGTPSSDDDRATDICTEGGEGCPEGVAGTILALHALPPLGGFAVFNPAVPGAGTREPYPVCPAREDREGTAYFGVSTNRPATITMEYRTREWRPDHGAVDWTEFTTATPAAGDEAWSTWFADDTRADSDPAAWIDTCFELEGLPPRDDYQARFTYTAKDDPSVTATNYLSLVPFTVAGEGGLAPGAQRRPTTILPLGVDQVFVGVTRTPGQQVAISARPRGNPASCNIAGDEHSIYDGEGTVRAVPVSETPIDPGVLSDPAYPYLRDHSISLVNRLDLEEGTDYVVCIYWLDAGPAFDSRVVTESETVNVSTPEAYRPTVVLQRLTNLVGDAQRVEISVPQCGGRTFSYDLTDPTATVRDRTGALQTYGDPIVVCTLDRRLNEVNRRGILVNTAVRDSGGNWSTGGAYIRTNVTCGTSPCLLRLNELAMLPLPVVEAGGECGTGFGTGCLRGTISAGDAIIELRYDGSVGSGGSSWVIGEPTPFDDSPPPLPEDPRISVSKTLELIDGHPTNGARARLTFVADRPVTLDVAVTGTGPTEEACSLGSVDGVSRTTPAMTHTVTLEPLCLGRGYRLTVTAADASGRLADVVGEGLRTPGNTIDFSVPPVLLTTDMSASISMAHDDHSHTVYVHPVRATSSDVTGPVGFNLGWTWPTADREAARRGGWSLFGLHGQANACGEPGAAPLEVFARRTPTGIPLQSHLLASQNGAGISFVVDIYANRTPGRAVTRDCARGELEESVVLSTDASLADLFDGLTLTSDSGRVRLTIRAVNFRSELIG